MQNDMAEVVSLKDVARLAGVSLMTVSRTFNNRDSVAPPTRQKVLAAARELGFIPNQLGRDLRQGVTRNVGALLSLCHPYLDLQYMRNLSWKLLSAGYSCQLVDSMSDPELIIRTLEEFYSRRFALIIFRASPGLLASEKIVELLKRFPAVVLICRAGIEERKDLEFCDRIIWESGTAFEEAVTYLRKKGRSKALVFSSNTRSLLMDIAREKGLECQSFDSGDWTSGPHSEIRIIDENFPGEFPFDTVFSKVDETAVIMIDHLRKRGLRVPEDVAVIGYNNTLVEGISPIPLASVDWNIGQMEKTLEHVVMERLKNPDSPKMIENVSYRFVRRTSCG